MLDYVIPFRLEQRRAFIPKIFVAKSLTPGIAATVPPTKIKPPGVSEVCPCSKS